MSTTEGRAKRIAKRFRLQDAVLLSLYTATALTLAIVAPNTVQLLRKVDPDMARKRHPSRRMSQAMSRLQSKALVKKDSSGIVRLTERGKLLGEKLFLQEKLLVSEPQKWDGRWRIVIFDIWERRRDVRDQLRLLLMKIGFVKVQNSVWAYPYDCEELLAFIKADLKVGKGMLYLIAEGIEGDTWLRKHFKLPN